MKLDVPKFTIVRIGRNSFRAFPRKLSADEAAKEGGEIVHEEYSYRFDEQTIEENLAKIAEIMFHRGVKWARDHAYEACGGENK